MDLSLAGSKLRKKFGAQLRESVSAPVSAFAVEQMQRLGWTEGTGLGRKRDGRVEHIRVVQRKDSAGLGSEKAVTGAALQDEWWKDSLGDTLAKLSAAADPSGKKKRSKKIFTDEELFEATGGARFGMRAGRTRNLAKWRRTESTISSSTSATNSSGTTKLPQQTDSTKTINENSCESSSCGKSHQKEGNEHTREEASAEARCTLVKASRKRPCETEEERKERKRLKRLKKEKKKRKKIERDDCQ